MKQPGIFFFFFGISYVFIYRIISTVIQKELFRFILLLCLGLIVPVALLLAVILSGGTFHRFWFWVVEYASAYGSIVKFDEGWYNLKYTTQLIWDHLALICICTGVGLFFTIRGKLQKNTNWILFLFACFSLLALLPGWYFRHHYFVFIAPLCSMFIGVGFYVFQKTEPKWKYLPLLLFGTVLCENILSHEHYYFITSPINVVKETYYGKFPESIEIGNFLASHTKPSDRIAVLGSEPQIFFYSKRRSVSGYIYMYSLMELQPYARRMQDELIADIEQKKPGYIVLYKISHSWTAKAGSDLHIIDWSTKYIDTYYSVAGIVEIIDVYNVQYMWGSDAQKYTPLSQEVIYIYKRNIDHHEP
jgi:hypothetical protein